MEVNIIILSTQSKKKDVLGFLKELKTLLQTEEFDSAKNLVLVKKEKLALINVIQLRTHWLILTTTKTM